MPRRPTLTGRIERRGHRNEVRSIRNRDRNVSFNPSIENNGDDEVVNDLLDDSFKCALKFVPRNFNSFSCGQLNLRCIHCGARNFEGEITQGNRNAFTLCCHKGKVHVSPYTQNDFFKSLYDGLKSNDSVIKSRSKHYFNSIRSYNSSFAMISSEAKIETEALRGIFHFKIHGVFYHRAGGIVTPYGSTPNYAQLYFYDVETAAQYRLRHTSNAQCNINLMREIGHQLNRCNPFVRSFHTMSEYCNRNEYITRDVCMLIRANHNVDIRRYNNAIATDVAVVFNSVNGEPPFERNMICFSRLNNTVRNVSVLDSSLDPLAYPLLFPNGDFGWHVNMVYNRPTTSNSNMPRNKITMLQYASYRLAIRDDFSILHHAQKLFLQWIVDMYVRIEGSRLHFIRNNQTNLRAEVYNNLTDFLNLHPNGGDNIHAVGRRVVLPSSFVGAPRNMYQNYLDAMSIVQHFGKPSLFITMTCNPRWPEIIESIDNVESSTFRPDIVVRVFKLKLKQLIDCIMNKHIFGKVEALIYTIEFQKRGLPHAHILVTLTQNDELRGANDIDKVVSAEIPNINTHPKLYEFVINHMIHGPCGHLNPNSVCMRDGKCIKNFPKDFSEQTVDTVNGYPVYRRRDNGVSVEVRGNSVDNRYVVPYNPYLLAKLNCHINVEICTTVKSVKYIYKYIYKGYDCAVLEVGVVNNEINGVLEIDEIENFLSGRFVGSTEACWRIFEFPMHYQTHSIIRLDCHLPNRQNVYYRHGQEEEAVANVRETKLLAFFHLNSIDNDANNLLYTEVPLHYVWIDNGKRWQKRKRGGEKVISRLYVVSPKNVELFHLRLLLLHVRGPNNFDDLRTYGDVLYPTFVAACHARGIASNDDEWRHCLLEAVQFRTPKQLRELFGFICALNFPGNALALWEEFKKDLSEDFVRNHNETDSFNLALLELEEIFMSHNTSCQQVGLPTPLHVQDFRIMYECDTDEAAFLFTEFYDVANNEQRNVIDTVLREVTHHDTGMNVFVLTAHAGCGKTFIQTALIHKLHSLNLLCISTAFSGIASTLLINGRTLHNIFKLPIPILENSVSGVSLDSNQANFIKSASLIIIDEISMCPLNALKAIDRLLNDLSNVENRNKPFGGKTILLCGDFRQILPVVPHGSRSELIENCIVSWNLFPQFRRFTLHQNMRALPHEVEFVEFLKLLGNGALPNFNELGRDLIEIPHNLISEPGNIIRDVFGDISSNIENNNILNSVILAPKNEDCSLINLDILNQIPGQVKAYYSYDRIICDDIDRVNDFPVEFLNSLNVSGLPPHKLELKINCIVLLIRNLNTAKGLVNGTRMRIKQMHRNSLDCEVLTGVTRGKRILIPRIRLTYSGTLLPFDFERTQFPVILAFAMTINKSQGQTFQKVGILLRQPVFTHGQLYVAASRVRSFDALKFYISHSSEQGHLFNNDRVFTKNIVFNEIIDP